MKKKKIALALGISILALFAVWTALLCVVDVQPIDPLGGDVGFATFNSHLHSVIGTHIALYEITDLLSLVPIFTALGFGILALCQCIKRKSPLKVDKSLIALCVFYIAVIGVYMLFEFVVINYRPILIEGVAEPSYPSSTTLLVSCVMPTAAIELNKRIKSTLPRRSILLAITAFTAFMVITRFLSGVHWTTDIIGGMIFSIGAVLIYSAVCEQQ